MEVKGYTLERIKQLFFSDSTKVKHVKKNDVLMTQGGINDRLYLVIEGSMKAYSDDAYENSFEVFRIRKDMFAGVYSFFSGTYISKTTIVAQEDTELAYLEARAFEEREDTELSIRFFLPVVLSDLNARMKIAHQLAKEKEQAMTHILESEKMAVLGQLAAGLAHELNNAVGVMKSKSEWVAAKIGAYLDERGDPELYPYFQKGKSSGQQLSSREVRERRPLIQETFGLDNQVSQDLARIGASIEELKRHSKNLTGLETYWDIGAAFYDIELASNHAAKVVQSVKELGAGSHEQNVELDVTKTIKDAITLIQSVLRQVEFRADLGDPIEVSGNSGELVQVWINLLKNACESMINAKTVDPLLEVTVEKKRKWAFIKVIDNGPGIPENLISRIFRPNVTTKKGGLSFGLGLGLPISQRIIERYGGTISVSSAPGKTVFLVKLPL